MPYQPPHRYTERELIEEEIKDWEVDLVCAARDNLPGYAEVCGKNLVELRGKLAALISVGCQND